MKKPQAQRILEVLQSAEWVNGRHFLHTMLISQFHTRIHELQKKGHNIKPSEDTDDYGFKSYKLMPKGQQQLI